MKFAVILLVCLWVALVSATAIEQHPAAAGGKHEEGATHSEYKQTKTSGKKSKHDHETAKKGEALKELHKKDDAEGGGKKTKHHSESNHHSSHGSGGDSEHGLKFQEAAHKKKSNFKKGYREKFHKDELKKHDSFFSNGHKSGDFEVFGEKHAKYNSHSTAKKHGVVHKAVQDTGDYKKSHAKAGGHNVNEKKGHKDQKSSKSHHNNQDSWAKKGGKKGGKRYKYTHK